MDINIEQDSTPWYAVRLFSLKLKEVRSFFASKDLEYFIPMTYVDVEDKDSHRIKHELKPVVYNLIFVKKTIEEKEMRKIVMDSPYKMAVIKKSPDSTEYYEIPAKQMYEFQMMCNPEILMRKYLSEGEAKLKKGTRVLVHYGPLKGLTGKLVRSNKKYYLLKEVPGLGVMLKVSRWCCKPIE